MKPYYSVESVKALDNYTLQVKFADGSTKICDLSDHLNRGVFKAFQDMNFFKRARAYCGAVIWNEDIDIAPEYLYEHGKDIS